MNIPTTSRGKKTLEKILRAAERIFGEKGYDQTSISEITRTAGVAQGTFYVYFNDKKQIFCDLVRELSKRLRMELAITTKGLTDRREIEREGFRAFFTFIAEHRNLYKLVRQAEFVDPETHNWYYQHLAGGYQRGLKAAMDDKQIGAIDPEVMAYCLMGIGDIVGMRWVISDKDGLPDSVFEDMMHFIENGLGPRSKK